VKTGGRLLKHAPYYWLVLAKSHLTRRLFGAMLGLRRCRRRRARQLVECGRVFVTRPGGQMDECVRTPLKNVRWPNYRGQWETGVA